MRYSRLWPVLTVFAILLTGTWLMELAADRHEAYYEQVSVTNSAGAEDNAEETAELTWQSMAPINPEHARARQLMRRADLDGSLEVFASLIAVEEPPVPLLTEYGFVLRRAGRCRDAEVVVAQALERAPDDGAVNLAVALTLRCLGNLDDARTAFERAIELRPNHSPTRLAYGDFLRRRESHTLAIQVLEPATERGSNDERAQALALIGRCLFEVGQPRQARDALEEAIERAPANVSIWVSVSRTYLRSNEQNDHLRALQRATQASRLAPELPTAHSAMGRAYEKLGLRLDAIDSYRQAARLDPTYEYALTRLVRLGLEEEEYNLARRSALGLLEINPDRAEYHFLHGLASSRTQDIEAARASYTQAIELRGSVYAEAWYNLGLLERDAGRPQEATEAYWRALEIRPDYEAAWNNLGLAYYDIEQYADAERAFRYALMLREDYAAAWINLGKTYAVRDQYAHAADAYERALDITPLNRTVRLRLAVAYRRTDRVEQAIELYRELIADEPRYVNAWYNMGIACSAAGYDADARRAYAAALEIDPNHVRSLKNLGLLEARLGYHQKAWTHLTDALDIDPTDYEVRLSLAELSYLSNDSERCARNARVVLTQAPDYAEAQELLDRCTSE